MVSKYHFQLKEARNTEEKSDSESGAGNVQTKMAHLDIPERELSKTLPGEIMSMGANKTLALATNWTI